MEDSLMDKHLPQFPQSFWLDSVELPRFPQLDENVDVDVAVVGGGITGIMTAFFLVKEGIKVALVEADTLLNGTTGHTTAKLTAQHGLIYDELIQNIGIEKAKLYYEANQQAIQFVKKLIEDLAIDCEFTRENAYLYTENEQYVQKLEKEMKAYEKLGINGELTNKIPLPFSIKAAVMMSEQAQFHPVKFLARIIQYLKEHECLIFEQTTALKVEAGKRPKVLTNSDFTVTADFIVSCSHFPFHDSGFYFTRMYAERSYVVAAKIKDPYPGGVYINAEQPTRSIRATSHQNETLILFGGENHKTGQGIDTHSHYEALKNFAETKFAIEKIYYRWSAQDLTTLDKIPYVGWITSTNPNLLVATGYRKWGMTNSIVSANLLKDIILNRKNVVEEVYSPSRFQADVSVKSFIETNVDAAKHLLQGKIERPDITAADLHNDEGGVILFHGKRAGAYKDKNGNITVVDTTCTHLGCEVEWNSGDRTWDCPCHGSRFSITGEVVEGPAEKPLKRLNE